MTWTPSHGQHVDIADIVRPLVGELNNVVDACDRAAERYAELTIEAKAEITKICTVARFNEIRSNAEAARDEIGGNILDYEGARGLPLAEAQEEGG